MLKMKIEGDKPALYQWDLNQRLILMNITENVEVHFSSYKDNRDSLILLSYEQDGIIYCDIPNILLQQRGVIYVYVCYQENDKTYTKYNVEILVIPREKPVDYVYSETEVMTFKSHEERIKKLEEKLKHNPTSEGYIFDNTLKFNDETNILSVNTTNKIEENNALPITSGAVYAEVGNIELLLSIL